MKTTIEERAHIIGELLAGRLTQHEAAERLSCTTRTIQRYVVRYRARGAAGLVHGLAGRRSNRAKPEALRAQIASLYREAGAGLTFSAFVRHVVDGCSIRLSRETIRHWLIDAGLRILPEPSVRGWNTVPLPSQE